MTPGSIVKVTLVSLEIVPQPTVVEANADVGAVNPPSQPTSTRLLIA
jgi:hypothetical protein